MKKILKICLLLMFTLLISGCEDKENNSSMVVYTSVYPTEYILDRLYGNSIAIYSIYPDGTHYNNYTLTNKQQEDYSNGDLFTYSGIIENEKNYAVNMLNQNKKIKIIDSTLGMKYKNSTEELWLDPANYLMMASNIKKGLKEYIIIENEKNKIEKNYEKLKLDLSSLDAELKLIANNSNSSNILIVSDDAFKFLEKYGFTVISLEENENLSEKIIADTKKILSNKMAHYIFLKDNDEENQTIKNLKAEYNVPTIRLNSLSTINAENRNEKNDYLTIMQDNINSIKLEIND